MASKKICNKIISYTDTGTGQVIVLLHGYLETKEVWTSFAQELSKSNRVVCIDIPGHGASENIGETHTMKLLAEHINLLLSELNIEQCALVGHSMGGYVALAYANNYSERLYSLVLFHSSVYADNDEKKTNRLREIKFIEQGKKDLIFSVNLPKMFADENADKFSREISQIQNFAKTHNEQGICAILKGMMERKDQQEFVKNFAKPMLFIFGEKDNYIPAEAGKNMLALNPEIKSAWMKNSGHMGFVEEQELALKVIQGFVETLE